jgi:hypothetical protein
MAAFAKTIGYFGTNETLTLMRLIFRAWQIKINVSV